MQKATRDDEPGPARPMVTATIGIDRMVYGTNSVFNSGHQVAAAAKCL